MGEDTTGVLSWVREGFHTTVANKKKGLKWFSRNKKMERSFVPGVDFPFTEDWPVNNTGADLSPPNSSACTCFTVSLSLWLHCISVGEKKGGGDQKEDGGQTRRGARSFWSCWVGLCEGTQH